MIQTVDKVGIWTISGIAATSVAVYAGMLVWKKAWTAIGVACIILYVFFICLVIINIYLITWVIFGIGYNMTSDKSLKWLNITNVYIIIISKFVIQGRYENQNMTCSNNSLHKK